MANEAISFEVADRRRNLHLTSVALSFQTEMDHWDAQKLCVGADVGGHRDPSFLYIRRCKILKSFWRVSDCVYRDFFYDQISEFVVRLRVVRAEINVESYGFPTGEFSLRGLNAVVRGFFLQRYFVRVFGFEHRPVEGD